MVLLSLTDEIRFLICGKVKILPNFRPGERDDAEDRSTLVSLYFKQIVDLSSRI